MLDLHKETFKGFWQWSENLKNYAMLHSNIQTILGWNLHIGDKPNPRSIRNFPMQANGAEMLRMACCLMVEAGIRVCAPLFDAVLIEAPLDDLDETILLSRKFMAEASAMVLGGFEL